MLLLTAVVSSQALLLLPQGGGEIYKAVPVHNAWGPHNTAAVPAHLHSQLDQRRKLLLTLQIWH